MSQPTSTRTRLRPDQRRVQLLDLGVGLLATRSLDELTIDLLAEEAGIEVPRLAKDRLGQDLRQQAREALRLHLTEG